MPTPLAPTNDPTLLPASVATRPTEAGMEAAARALDGEALQGRKAVRRLRRAPAATPSRPVAPDGRGRRVDRTA